MSAPFSPSMPSLAVWAVTPWVNSCATTSSAPDERREVGAVAVAEDELVAVEEGVVVARRRKCTVRVHALVLAVPTLRPWTLAK